MDSSPLNLPDAAIYVITNTFNGHQYVGSSAKLRDRWYEHQHDLRTGCHPNQHLQRAWAKYGESAFTFAVLEIISDLTIIFEREQHWIDALQPAYNILRVAGSALGFRHRPESIERMRKVQKGRPRSTETRAKLSAALKGRPLPDAVRVKMTASRLGGKHSEEWKKHISQGLVGHAVSDETRRKMSDAAKRRKPHVLSPEHRERLNAGLKAHRARKRQET